MAAFLVSVCQLVPTFVNGIFRYVKFTLWRGGVDHGDQGNTQVHPQTVDVEKSEERQNSQHQTA